MEDEGYKRGKDDRKMFMMSTRKRDRIRKQMRGSRGWDPFTLSIHSCDDKDRHTGKSIFFLDLFLIFHFHFCLLLTLTYFHSFRASIDKKPIQFHILPLIWSFFISFSHNPHCALNPSKNIWYLPLPNQLC